MKTELKVIIYHSEPITKRNLKSYTKDAICGWKGGYMPEHFAKSIKRVTFKHPNNEKVNGKRK